MSKRSPSYTKKLSVLDHPKCECIKTDGSKCANNAKLPSNFCGIHKSCKTPMAVVSEKLSPNIPQLPEDNFLNEDENFLNVFGDGDGFGDVESLGSIDVSDSEMSPGNQPIARESLDLPDEFNPGMDDQPIARESLDFINDFLGETDEEKAITDSEIAQLALLDQLGWYHIPSLEPYSAEPKKIKKMMLVINSHGGVCQTCHIEYDNINPSIDIDIERTDGEFINIEAKQNGNTVAKIATSICGREQPITVINFPCAIDFATSRTHNPRFGNHYLNDTCVSKVYTNNFLSKTTNDNLDNMLERMVTEKFAPENQQSFTPYAGIGQTYIKNQSKLLYKIFQVQSNEPDCGSVDLYIYDDVGTHKYTIMAPPKPPRDSSPRGYIEVNDDSKYNQRVLNSFQELSTYYDGIINTSIYELKQKMIFQCSDDIRFCTTSLPDILAFMDSFRIFGCQMKQYVIDFSCFSASEKNYKKEALQPAQRENIDRVIARATKEMRHLYGGKLSKRKRLSLSASDTGFLS